jgi:hypothetical protein
MTAVKGIKEVTEMKMFAATVGILKRLPRLLPVQRNEPAKHDESAMNDELVMARIAQACPDLIVMATELRFRVM